MDMFWYVSRCLVSSMYRYVVNVVSCVVGSIVGVLSYSGSRLVSLSDASKCKFSELLGVKEYVSVRR